MDCVWNVTHWSYLLDCDANEANEVGFGIGGEWGKLSYFLHSDSLVKGKFVV
jgi:hypothetical protein